MPIEEGAKEPHKAHHHQPDNPFGYSLIAGLLQIRGNAIDKNWSDNGECISEKLHNNTQDETIYRYKESNI
jgi:hypothetical protein